MSGSRPRSSPSPACRKPTLFWVSTWLRTGRGRAVSATTRPRLILEIVCFRSDLRIPATEYSALDRYGKTESGHVGCRQDAGIERLQPLRNRRGHTAFSKKAAFPVREFTGRARRTWNLKHSPCSTKGRSTW